MEQLRIQIKRYRELDSHTKTQDNSGSEDSNEDDIDDSLDICNPSSKKKMSVIPRSAVSAEAYGAFNKKENFVARKIPKTNEQISRIKARIVHSFLFSSLDLKDLEVVISAMEEKKYAPNENIIKQGESGDVLYFVEEGSLECYKQFNKKEEPKMVKKYGAGESFGELALLYNAPRAATVKSITESILWCLDRETFNHIVKDAAQKKREKYESFLKKVEILSTIEPYELMQISDALKSSTFHNNDYIIKEGELGDVFYILEEGECVATKTIEPGKPEKEIKSYKVGEYFGERALIKGEPRYANIIAKSTLVKVISLDRDSFKRLLGPIEELLKRNLDKYEIFVKNDTS